MKFSLLILLIFLGQVNLNPVVDSVLDFFISRISIEKIKSLNINTMCALQIELVLKNKNILIQMIDASAKFPYSGMIDAGRTEMGNYDQCLAIDHNIKGIKLLGKYCFAGLVIPDINNVSNVDMYYKLATCVPEACSAKDFHTIANAMLVEGFPPVFIDDYCSTKDTGKELSVGTIISMFIFFSILGVVIMSTLYDIYSQKAKEKIHPLWAAFSVVSNTKNILKVSLTPSKERIQIFHGFRAISVAWIINSHAAQIFVNGVIPVINHDEIVEIMNTRKATYLFAATLAVTTFFYMSGFLVSYLYFKRKPQSWIVQVKSIPVLYIYRYIRLTVPLVMIYITVLFVFEKIGNGPIWHFACETEKNNCKKYWWSYFFYLQNYANWDQMCIIPLWYLSVDMQLFLLSPFILIPTSMVISRKNGFKLAMLMLASINIFFVILNIGIREIFPKTTENYYVTHGRLADYFIGLMMGVFMRFKKDELFLDTINRKWASVINVVIWIAVLISMFCLFLFYEDAVVKFGPTHKTLFMAFSSVIWAVGLSWMVYSCYHGYGGVISWFLFRPIFQVLGKLSYAMYLTHYLVLGHFSFSNRIKEYMSIYNQFYFFCGIFIETLLVSFVWSLAIESPIVALDSYIFGKVKNEVAEPKNNKNNPESEA